MLKSIHTAFGISMIIVFLLTGQYMHHFYNHLDGMENLPRALYRAGHLYILLFGLINLTIGTYLQLRTHRALFLQKLGSIIIAAASILCVYSFFSELPATEIERPISRISLYLIFLGVASHYVASINFTK